MNGESKYLSFHIKKSIFLCPRTDHFLKIEHDLKISQYQSFLDQEESPELKKRFFQKKSAIFKSHYHIFTYEFSANRKHPASSI